MCLRQDRFAKMLAGVTFAGILCAGLAQPASAQGPNGPGVHRVRPAAHATTLQVRLGSIIIVRKAEAPRKQCGPRQEHRQGARCDMRRDHRHEGWKRDGHRRNGDRQDGYRHEDRQRNDRRGGCDSR
jgi:hypothetical protein